MLVICLILCAFAYIGIKIYFSVFYRFTPEYRKLREEKIFTDNFFIENVDCLDGHSFELFCAELLKSNGYNNVRVTKGSGDMGVDILAEKSGMKYAIQCKCYSSNLGNKPVQEIFAGKEFYHCDVGVVMTNRYFTAGAKKLAEATEILLWDRNVLENLIKTKAAQ